MSHFVETSEDLTMQRAVKFKPSKCGKGFDACATIHCGDKGQVAKGGISRSLPVPV